MTLRIDRWPFAPMNTRSFEESEQWWQDCYVAHPIMEDLIRHPLWTILTGIPGSGKTTTLNALRREARISGNALVIEYPPERWPDNAADQPSHFERIVSFLADEVSRHFHNHPGEIRKLDLDQKQFLRWMIEKHKGTRAYHVWQNSLGDEYSGCMDHVDYQDIYPAFKRKELIGVFIFEILELCKKIGARQVCILVDCPPHLEPDQIILLNRLYAWLEPMEHPTFRVIAAMTPELSDQIQFHGQMKQRISFKEQKITDQWIRTVTNRVVSSATFGAITRLEDLIQADSLTELQQLIDAEFPVQSPAVWLNMTQSVLEFATNNAIPLGSEGIKAIHRQFCLTNCPIKPGESGGHKGVWRGARFIQLVSKEFDLLNLLYEQQGRQIQLPNIYNYKDVSRLRQKIEPDTKNWIYVQVEKNGGYWLENFVARDKFP